MENEASIVLWNVEWAKPGTRRGNLVLEYIDPVKPDVLCLNEVHEDLLDNSWHTIWGGIDPDMKVISGRRKVLLASRQPWELVDDFGNAKMPPGRFLAARTQTPIGQLLFVAVCIPWRMSHVSVGRKDRSVWGEHLAFLDGLEDWLSCTALDRPTVLLGDFNQRIPRKWSPVAVYDRLINVIEPQFTVITSGNVGPIGEQSIDHVALSPDLNGKVLGSLPSRTKGGIKISDHFGLEVGIRAKSQ